MLHAIQKRESILQGAIHMQFKCGKIRILQDPSHMQHINSKCRILQRASHKQTNAKYTISLLIRFLGSFSLFSIKTVQTFSIGTIS